MEALDRIKAKLITYQPNDSVHQLLAKSYIVLLAAISGGGKDTIKNRLLATGKYHHIITNTTRPPRSNDGVKEQDGVDYHFIDFARAERMLDEGAFIEADIYADNLYGTGVDEIQKAYDEGKIGLTEITIEGTLQVLKLAPTVKVVFLLPPSYEIWMERLMRRYGGTEKVRDIQLRLQEAVGEIKLAMASEQMYIVINDTIDDTVALVDEIAHNNPVEPHYHKAMEVAQQLLDRLEQELSRA